MGQSEETRAGLVVKENTGLKDREHVSEGWSGDREAEACTGTLSWAYS